MYTCLSIHIHAQYAETDVSAEPHRIVFGFCSGISCLLPASQRLCMVTSWQVKSLRPFIVLDKDMTHVG